MLRAPICTGVWVLTILWSVASVGITAKQNGERTLKENNFGSIADVSHRCHRDYYNRRDNVRSRNADSGAPSIEHIQRNSKDPLNEVSRRDPPSMTVTFEADGSVKAGRKIRDRDPDCPRNPAIEGSCNSAEDLSAASNAALPLSRGARRRSDAAGNLWKRRTLCSLTDGGRRRRTLSGLIGPTLTDDAEDPDSSKTLVRVKRTGSSLSSPYEQEYFKDLADSFPRSSYRYVDENVDGEPSFDAKREANYYVENERSSSEEAARGLDELPSRELKENKVSEDDKSSSEQASSASRGEEKLVEKNARSVAPAADREPSFDAKREANSRDYCVENERSSSEEAARELGELPSREFKENKVSEDEKSSSEQASSASRGEEKLIEKNARSVAPAADREPPKERAVERRDSETVPEDPALSVELVRRRRNDRAKIERKRNLEKSPGDEAEKPLDGRKQADGADKLEEAGERCPKASSLAIANLKAELLRFKRKARNERREKSYKSKKKKKHAGKKRNESKGEARRSRKTARTKHAQRPRSARDGMSIAARADGKSHVGFSKLASNQNNFRRRSVSPMIPFDNVSGKDRASRDTSANVVETNNGNAGGSAVLSAEEDGGRASEASDERLDGSVERGGRDVRNGNPSGGGDDAKTRSKRDRTAESRHGFRSDEDELRYYEKIREFEPSTECSARDDGSANSGAELGRAARSIEEVRDLAKMLVTKVDELENYLSVDEAERDDKVEKRIGIRAIDDLCSNVTATCADFKETSEIVQRCLPTSTAKIVADKKVRKKEAYNRAKQKKGSFAMKKRSSQENNAKTPSKPSKNSRRETDNSRKWGRWTDWSSCSVTCGKGRQIRWRYCLRDCTVAETEMEEKACQLPACPPGKFLGIF
ncbi:uncharacterized protein LOC117223579 isoform X1 [Megalopta genalis]|uniref:uncharacterized protein LOC117223579 isoform X1 n=1 Tax=Megalopta genalis TaxID=115081 RepID=UPI003FD3252B